MKKLIILWLIMMACSAMTLGAKDLKKFYLTGYIVTDGYTLLDSVEVSLTKNDSIAVPFKVLSKPTGGAPGLTKGEMRLLVESGFGDYRLVLDKDGYTPLVKEFKISAMSEDLKRLDLLTMTKAMHHEIGEVTVTATRLKMVMKGDTLVYDAAAFNLADGSMLDALVRQLPGASIDDQGVITVNGRKMKELLVNGKDFFKGDPKVALQNLPAYTVKDIKVYDKADDDAYLTQSNLRLSKNEEQENMVMDVMLKKDYNAGWMGNVEGGYGTEERYRGRLFGMGYTKNLRISVFGNLNNVGDTETATSDGNWRRTGNESGVTNRQRGGLDYTYDDSKRVRVTGNVAASHHNRDINEIISATNIYPSGNIFSRSINLKNERASSLSTNHTFQYKGDNLYLRVSPRLNWNVNNTTDNNRSADFTVNPQEKERGQIIETLFNDNFKGEYSRNMYTALWLMRKNHNTLLNTGLDLDATIRPKTWRGVLSVQASGDYSSSPSNTFSSYRQAIGPEGDQSLIPQSSDNYSPVEQRNSSFNGNIGYMQDWRHFGDKYTNRYGFSVTAAYRFAQGRDTTDYFLKNMQGDMSMLPSMSRPVDMEPQWANTHYSRTLTNALLQRVRLYYQLDQSAPGDSTFNPSLYASIYGVIIEQNERMRYNKPTIMNERVSRPSTLGQGSVSLGFSSQNKMRYMSLSLSHEITMTAPSLMYLVNTIDTSDPFNVTYGNPDGLANAIKHRTTVSFARYGRGKHPLNIYWDFHYNATNNAIAMARSYDPATGISTLRPENIKGNWNIDSYLQVIPTFGSRNQWQLYTVVYGELHHDVDYLGLETEPSPSVIHTRHLHNNLRLTYQINKIGSVTFSTTNGVTYVRYPDESAGSGTFHNHSFGISTTLNLPCDFNFTTNFDAQLNRGYQDKSMNINQWIWNASIGRNLLKGKMNVKLSAYDILQSVRPVTMSASAQRVAEIWRNTLPRYVMATVAYRFDIKPAKGGHNGPSRW